MREWVAFHQRCETGERPDDVWLLALGGLRASARQTVAQFTQSIQSAWKQDVRALAAHWSDLSRALNNVDPANLTEQRILESVNKALELHGHRAIQPMTGLAELALRYRVSPASAKALRKGGSFGRRAGTLPPPANQTAQLRAMSGLADDAARYPLQPGSVARLARHETTTERSRRR